MIGGATPPPVNPVAAFFNAVGTFISKFLSKKVAGFTIRSILTAATVAVGVRNIQQMRDLMNKGQNILATKVAQGGKNTCALWSQANRKHCYLFRYS